MKKHAWVLNIALSLVILSVVFYFSSCSKEQAGIKKPVKEETSTQQKSNNAPGLIAARGCGIRVCLLDFIPGNRAGGGFDCTGSGICFVSNITCFPEFVLCPEFKIPDCPLRDCGNPWNYRDAIVKPIVRYRDLFQGDPHPEPSLGFIPLKITPSIAILQFYAEVKGTLDQKTLKLPAAFNLPNNVAQSIGLKGNKVPAGTYPVVFDAQSKTFNAIVSVQ